VETVCSILPEYGLQKSEPTVGAIILSGKGQTLLARSYKWGDRYTTGGGLGAADEDRLLLHSAFTEESLEEAER
jgi:hypothetical protein